MQDSISSSQHHSPTAEYSLGYALELWKDSKEFQRVNVRFMKHLSTALKLYVFPELAPETELTSKSFDALCDTLFIVELKNGLDIYDRRFAEAVEQGNTARSTGKNYRSALRRFLNWVNQQVWWQCIFYGSDVIVAPPVVKLPKKPGTGGELSLYGLSMGDLPQHLIEEIEDFKEFRLTGIKSLHQTDLNCVSEKTRVRRPKVVKVKLSTFESSQQRILRFLGWYVEHHLLKKPYLDFLENYVSFLKSKDYLKYLTSQKERFLVSKFVEFIAAISEYLLSDLRLDLLTDIDLLDEYVYWAIEERKISYATAKHFADTAVAIAKWLNYEKSTRRDWSDIQLILDLQDLRNEYSEDYGDEKKRLRVEKWAAKEITHEEARQVVDYLRKCCAPYSDKARVDERARRSIAQVTRLWQTYLFIKILVYCPVRQEEIRQYVLGKTLFRREDEEGNPYYEAYFREHKRSDTNEDRNYKLPNILTSDLDLWLYKWRPLIEKLIQTEAGWMSFWGHDYEEISLLHQKIALAKQGVISARVRRPEHYLQELERKLQGKERRITGWQVAKSNFKEHNHVFFLFGKRGIEAFGKPFSRDNFWEVVTRAIAKATQALFNEAKWINPHALRNIAEKHIRQLGKTDITEPFAVFIGHTEKMGDEYAEQLTSEYELTEDITDDWWLEEE